jgi:hypothetical protein
VQLAVFADDTCLYTTDRKQGYVLRKPQRASPSVESWREGWKKKINEVMIQAVYEGRLKGS